MLDGDSAACFFTWPELQPEFKRPSENKTHVSSENVPILWCFTLNLCAFNHALYTLLYTDTKKISHLTDLSPEVLAFRQSAAPAINLKAICSLT